MGSVMCVAEIEQIWNEFVNDRWDVFLEIREIGSTCSGTYKFDGKIVYVREYS